MDFRTKATSGSPSELSLGLANDLSTHAWHDGHIRKGRVSHFRHEGLGKSVSAHQTEEIVHGTLKGSLYTVHN